MFCLYFAYVDQIFKYFTKIKACIEFRLKKLQATLAKIPILQKIKGSGQLWSRSFLDFRPEARGFESQHIN